MNRKRERTHLCPLDGDAVAAARGQPHVLDGVRVQQVHAPPRRLLALCLGTLKSEGERVLVRFKDLIIKVKYMWINTDLSSLLGLTFKRVACIPLGIPDLKGNNLSSIYP